LEKFRAKVADRALAKRLTARAARAAERSRIKTTREIERAEKAERAQQAKRDGAIEAERVEAESAERKRSSQAEQKPARDARYAARNRDRSAGKFAVSLRRWRRAREVALADLDAVPRQIETVGRLAHVQKVGLVDLARGGLCEGGVEAVEVLDEDGNGHGVHEKPSSVAQT
jgi:hypothetical protein